MYVKDNMTRNPYTVTADQTISEVIDLMSVVGVHRLPVVDKAGKLVGLLSESIIKRYKSNEASSLSVYELNYLLNKLTVKDVMIKEPYCINPDSLIEEAATMLVEKEIGGLPVIDNDNLLVGIITQNDILDAFIEQLGYKDKCSRYVINITEDKAGILEDIGRIFKEQGISIRNLAVYRNERGIEILAIVYSENNITDVLKAQGYNVTAYLDYTKKS